MLTPTPLQTHLFERLAAHSRWWPLLLLIAPLALCGASLADGLPLGRHQGELWGHLFSILQVQRWFNGTTAWGHADLLLYPDGQAFWPTAPLLHVWAIPTSPIFGHIQSWNLFIFILCFIAGFGPALLCRTLGIGVSGSVMVGWMTQLSPYLLRNLQDAVIEVGGIGLFALSIRSVIQIIRARETRPRHWLAWTASLSALTACSPYYMVYLAIGLGVCIPFLWAVRKRLMGLGFVGATVAITFLTPFLLTESGEHGRLGPEYSKGGYSLNPTPLKTASGARVRPGPKPNQEGSPGPQEAPPKDQGLVIPKFPKNPMGWTLTLCLGLGCAGRKGRWWALGGLSIIAAGPGPTLLARVFNQPSMAVDGPLTEIMRHTPLLSSLGNSQRLLAPAALLIVVAAALSLPSKTKLRLATAVPLAFLAMVEGLSTLGHTSLPVSPVLRPPAETDATAQSIVVFPSGEPPYWSWRTGPKEALYLAARSQIAVVQDYGRGRYPQDVLAHQTLATIGSVGLGQDVWRANDMPDDLSPNHLLLLDSRLDPNQRLAIHSWLERNGEFIAQSADISIWRVDDWTTQQ